MTEYKSKSEMKRVECLKADNVDTKPITVNQTKFDDLAVYNLTKREYFAAMVMGSLIRYGDSEYVAKHALHLADALIRALEQDPIEETKKAQEMTVAP